jgi:hypothetical protein
MIKGVTPIKTALKPVIGQKFSTKSPAFSPEKKVEAFIANTKDTFFRTKK